MFATVIDCYYKTQTEFEMTDGYQPLNSFFHLKSGSFSLKIDEREEIATAGDLVFFDTETHFSRHVLQPVEFLYIKLRKTDADLFPLKTGIYRNLTPREIEDIQKVGTSVHLLGDQALAVKNHYLNDLILSLSARQDDAQLGGLGKTPVLEKSLGYIHRNISAKITVEDLANDAQMSVSSFSAKFKKATGSSVYDFLIQLRLTEVQRLLAETDYTVTEIAERCGYANTFYLCNAFKKHTGLTPTQFRHKNRT